jgi:hypothetical protein
MPEPDRPARAVYDHTEEEPRPSGRRRRQVADWGVGEELFDGMPGNGRRFERRGEDHRIPRGGADDGRRTIRIADDEMPAGAPPEVLEEAFASREEALRARAEHDTVWAGDEPFADKADEPDESPLAEPRDLAAPLAYEGHRPADGVVRGGVEGRRTIKIGGQPAEFYSAPRRPARTVHERVGPRPDRIAAWAFALGILLILIAVATANI